MLSATWFSPRLRRTAGVALLASAAALTGATQAVAAGDRHAQASGPLTVRPILNGAAHGWSSPDDVTALAGTVFAAFQNGVPSTGGSAGTQTQSTIVSFGLDGTIRHTWQITGKCDGLTADPHTHQLIATVNEDGNSSLYTVPTRGDGAPQHYRYDARPLPHGGGTDSVTVYRGSIYLVASAPSAPGPAVYRVILDPHGVAHLAAAPFYDDSTATRANPGGGTTTLALTDPDSSTVVPHTAPRFRGDFMLDSQGDQQAVFAAHLGSHNQRLQVLNLSQAVDDTAFPTSRGGALLAADANADTIDLITGTLTPGTAYTAVTPSGANNPTVPTPANYLGTLDLSTGTVTPLTTTGAPLAPHSLLYLPATQ